MSFCFNLIYSGLIPQLIAEIASIWGTHILIYGIERSLLITQRHFPVNFL